MPVGPAEERTAFLPGCAGGCEGAPWDPRLALALAAGGGGAGAGDGAAARWPLLRLLDGCAGSGPIALGVSMGASLAARFGWDVTLPAVSGVW